jgi:hypothetical protein
MFQLRVGRNEPIEQRLHARLTGYWRSIATTAIADALEAPEYVDIEVVLLCSGEEPLERRRDSTGWLGKGTPCVAPFRKAKIPFGNAIPLSPVFLGAQKVSHLPALNGMPTKVFRRIHWASPATVFSKNKYSTGSNGSNHPRP